MSTVKTAIKGTAIQTPSSDPASQLVVLRQLKEVVEIGQRVRGDPNDSFVRVSELVNINLARMVNGTVQPFSTTGSGSGVPTSRNVNTTAPLTGGGSLAADLTLGISIFGTSTSGAVPASGGGTTNFLRADGTWTAPGGGGGVTSPLTTKGDIWVFGSADTRLPVGTNGTILTADSTQATGLSWGAPVQTLRGAAWVASSGAITIPINDVPVIIPYGCTLKEVTILTQGGTGSCTVDVWKAAYSAYPPTVANTICGGTPPAIASGIKYQNSTLTGWTTAFAQGDVLMFHLSANTTFTEVIIMLRVQ